jgi:hypothetical protein
MFIPDESRLQTMPKGHVPWPSIEGLEHTLGNVRRIGLPLDKEVAFKAKIKLHGTNAAIRLNPDGSVSLQSRSNDVSVEADNYGFARAFASSGLSLGITNPEGTVVVIYGEWAGGSIQRGVSLTKLPPAFYVFAIRVIKPDEDDEPHDLLLVEPDQIQKFLDWIKANADQPQGENPFPMRVLPWYEFADGNLSVRLNLVNVASTNAEIEKINAEIEKIEKVDPYVASISDGTALGAGEGLVFYPTGIAEMEDRTFKIDEDADEVFVAMRTTVFRRLSFKAKGEQHRVKASSAAVKTLVEKPAGVSEFATMFVTPARCEQMLQQVGGDRSMKGIGPFLKAVMADVEKESKLEMEAGGLTWKQVAGDVTAAAKAWFMGGGLR